MTLSPFPDRIARESRAFLAELRTEISHHPGVNHLFLNRLATSPFAKQDYRIFAENHFPLVCVFTHYLELLLIRAPDSEAKLWLAKVLIDEYGEGSDGHDHAHLYGNFLDSTGGDHEDRMAMRVPEPALRFIRMHQEIVRTEPFLVGLGAIGPGHEWAIPEMFEAVIPGLRRAGFNEVEIGYFTLHVEQDDDHGRWLEEALADYAIDDVSRAQIRRGAMLSLDARAEFWSGVQREVVRYRQPRAVRPDGPVSRSIAGELLATTWDGSRGGRFIDRLASRLRSRKQPRLFELLHENRHPFTARRG